MTPTGMAIFMMQRQKRQYEQDRKNVEAKHLEDHYLCTDIDRMEKIALQMPLSGMKRPAWICRF